MYTSRRVPDKHTRCTMATFDHICGELSYSAHKLSMIDYVCVEFSVVLMCFGRLCVCVCFDMWCVNM